MNDFLSLDIRRGPRPELVTEPLIPHERIAETGRVIAQVRAAALRGAGVLLSPRQVSALADAPAVRAVLCELCRTCRACGCTCDIGCNAPDGEGCHWVEPDLCSACAAEASRG